MGKRLLLIRMMHEYAQSTDMTFIFNIYKKSKSTKQKRKFATHPLRVNCQVFQK